MKQSFRQSYWIIAASSRRAPSTFSTSGHKLGLEWTSFLCLFNFYLSTNPLSLLSFKSLWIGELFPPFFLWLLFISGQRILFDLWFESVLFLEFFLSFIQNLMSFSSYWSLFFQICIYCWLHIICRCQRLTRSNLFKSSFLIIPIASFIIFRVICKMMLTRYLRAFFLCFRVHFDHDFLIWILGNMTLDHLQVWRQTTAVTHLTRVIRPRALRTSTLGLGMISLRYC